MIREYNISSASVYYCENELNSKNGGRPENRAKHVLISIADLIDHDLKFKLITLCRAFSKGKNYQLGPN